MRIVSAKLLSNVCAAGGNGLTAEIDTISTHVSDEPLLVELLGTRHGSAAAHAELAIGLLLEGASGKWRSRVARAGRLGNVANGETSATQARQKVVGSLLAVKALLELSLEFFAFYRKVCCYTKLCTTGKIANLALALYKQAHRWALNAASRFATRHLAPHHRAQLEAHNAVEDLPCLLSLHELHIYGARLLDGCLDGGLGDLVEGNALGVLLV